MHTPPHPYGLMAEGAGAHLRVFRQRYWIFVVPGSRLGFVSFAADW